MKATERFEKVNIDRLVPQARNARTHSKEQILQLRASLREFGFVNPVIVDKDLNIIAGHGRIMAAREEGLTDIPCVFVEHLTKAQKKAYIIADNKLAENAGWDLEILEIELEELRELDFDIGLIGFDDEELQEMFGEEEAEVQEDDFDVDDAIPEEPKTKFGDIYQLGSHRVMCGDSTDKATVEKLMNGVKADMVFTDPPYGVNVKGGKGKGNTIAGDLTQTAIPFSFEICVKQATKDKARFYFCGAEGNIGLYFKLFERYLAQIPKLLIWVKNGFVLKQNGYHNQYELIFYGFKAGGGGKEYWYSGRTEDEASDVWRVSRGASTSYLHPTQKPIELPARAIRNSSKAGDTIFDPFGGSGSTLIACEQLNRTCYMMEIDPVYCDVIVKRWENFTGQKAVLLSG